MQSEVVTKSIEPGPVMLLSRSALLYNVKKIRSVTQNAKIFSVMKGNAYGHGMRTVSAVLQKEVDGFAVARFSEAVSLRRMHPSTPILILGGVYTPTAVGYAAENSLQLVIHEEEQVRLLSSMKSLRKSSLSVWIKVD
eukprot:Blabericola_migrator_1__7330@NODE_3729_length_1551_cov_3_264825_g2316_i0_p2_GENE_NODE_3729_length_1551_cov_3_264825_g2316_i0NODE_3729_length_1551_cov_3_264825_g2316_i0_p2_ORF_typecomplete_len138_score7_69Ala_racemase_N/PF01168_20/8_3e17_NODE_3729_length_1551_cov_3_264825_g2316_i0538951